MRISRQMEAQKENLQKAEETERKLKEETNRKQAEIQVIPGNRHPQLRFHLAVVGIAA